jgi:4-diphosphocytidyl-2-C-methyl-D-erythritol kinase
MLFFPNCKINLGLNILRRRDDGYHDLDTVFYPLPLRDVLELIRSPEKTTFTAYGLPIPGDPDANLCLKARHLLSLDFPTLPPVHIHLYKNIPIGAGLGGGSSDGAHTLLALNRQFQLGLTREQLLTYAAHLGSDCAFFIANTPAIGTGRGNQLEPIPIDLSAYSFVLVDPQVHIGTAQAFSLCTPGSKNAPIKDIIGQPIDNWRGQLVNDFEEPLFRIHPHLREIKDTLYHAGAHYASLTGSGSAFYGIFEKNQAPSANPFRDRYIYRILP